MYQFTIQTSQSMLIEKTPRSDGKFYGHECLKHHTVAFYHDNYFGGGRWRQQGTIENMICTLKNDITPYPEVVLVDAFNQLTKVLKQDLLQVINHLHFHRKLIVCVVPRAKREEHYAPNQRLFRQSVQEVIRSWGNIEDGSYYILRHTDTVTTHLTHHTSLPAGHTPRVYCGITNETCSISANVQGGDILLIDDLYTKGVGIDEDCIQALYDNGANSVILYTIGRTVKPFQQPATLVS